MSFYLLDHPNPNTAQYTYPRRGSRGRLSGTCILHTSEGYGALATAQFIARRTDYGSYHRLCDWDQIIAMAPWEYEVWQDSETNNWAVGIAAAVKAAEWHLLEPAKRDRVYRNMAACAAEFVAYMRDEHQIAVPIRRISGGEARAGVPGFCAHGDSGLYRSDPGAQFDWALFFQYTQEALGSGAIAPAGTTSYVQEDELSQQEVERIINEVGTIIAQHHKATRETVTGTGGEVKDLVVDQAVRIQQNTQKQTEAVGRVTQQLIIDNAKPAVLVEQIIAAGIAKEVVDLLVVRLAA